ncbi:MAG TPA: 3-oxoacyl-[acyl-carrier-protein] synthase III C-terminal domain-containing protein [Candidatus Binatia bacterium]|nr:3-oxoacyl-[acyl-carrier-protein] synthase III C-terminal domain-containing protein [Candidatus Binatia bacterium]
MFITGLGTALPQKRFTQAECWKALQAWEKLDQLKPRSRAILKKVLLQDNGIASRHLALDALSEAFVLTPEAMHTRFARHAPLLASQAGERALQNAGWQAERIDAVIVSTCTGYLCPGLTSYVSEGMGLRPDVLALDLVGQGCSAALPNLRTGEALLASGRCRSVLSICVEVCSAAIYLDDDPGVLISACLFGDGAGAAVLSARPFPGVRLVEWKRAGSVLDPGSRDLLRFEQRRGLLRNILTPPVPALAAKHAQDVFRDVTTRADVKRKEISNWIFHAGGRDVLLALRRQFELDEAELSWSASVLRDLGNVSSPFVFHALERALNRGACGGWWWMSSFGAGFSCHGALLEVR